jgi:hypothetical protein
VNGLGRVDKSGWPISGYILGLGELISQGGPSVDTYWAWASWALVDPPVQLLK